MSRSVRSVKSKRIPTKISLFSSQMSVRANYVTDVNQMPRFNPHWGNTLSLDFFSHIKAL